MQIWDLKDDRCLGTLNDSHHGMVFCVASDASRIVSYVRVVISFHGLWLNELFSTSHDMTMAVQDCEQTYLVVTTSDLVANIVAIGLKYAALFA